MCDELGIRPTGHGGDEVAPRLGRHVARGSVAGRALEQVADAALGVVEKPTLT